MKKRKVYLASSCTLIAAALAACTPVKKDDAAIVEQRAVERWNLLIAHQAEKAYDYLTPGYRLTMPRDKYAARMNDTALRWTGAHFGSRKCDADTCTVTMMIDVQVIMPGVGKPQPTTMPVEERWIRSDKVWYFLPDWHMKGLSGEAGEAPAPAPADAAKHPL